jgi:predicted RNase H-like nuclease (RuvC/YqgF family)
MEPNYSKIFNKETLGSVESFCKLNNIDDVDSFIKNVFQEGFNIKKYGLLGNTVNKGEKDLKTGIVGEKQAEIEVIREIRVEVPVEVIKEIEKIVEVPVEVIKEVPVEIVVEKIIYTTDDNQINELGEKNAKLEIELFENSEQLDKLLSKIEHLNGEISIKSTEIDNIRQEFSIKTKEMENFYQNEMSKKDKELDELRHNLDIPVTNNRVEMLQETILNLNTEIRNLKKQIKELENKTFQQPQSGEYIKARFHGSSNLND